MNNFSVHVFENFEIRAISNRSKASSLSSLNAGTMTSLLVMVDCQKSAAVATACSKSSEPTFVCDVKW